MCTPARRSVRGTSRSPTPSGSAHPTALSPRVRRRLPATRPSPKRPGAPVPCCAATERRHGTSGTVRSVRAGQRATGCVTVASGSLGGRRGGWGREDGVELDAAPVALRRAAGPQDQGGGIALADPSIDWNRPTATVTRRLSSDELARVVALHAQRLSASDRALRPLDDARDVRRGRGGAAAHTQRGTLGGVPAGAGGVARAARYQRQHE